MMIAGALAVLALAVVVPVPAAAQTAAETKPKTKSKAGARARRPRSPHGPPATYMGRSIAEVMSYLGADWLVRESREKEEQPDRMLDALKIARGSVVADVGAGVGYNSLRLSKRVGPEGTVHATDLQPEMLKMLVENARDAGVTNIKTALCTPTDPKLPAGALDLVLMVDVYHECSAPAATLQGLRQALKPGGRLVLVEFRAEDPEVPIRPEHKMSLAQVRKEVEPQGFVFKESLEFLPWQHIVIFEKPAEASGPGLKRP